MRKKKKNTIVWSKTIVTDAPDVSNEKGGLPQQKALTLEMATLRERLVNSGAPTCWTADASNPVGETHLPTASTVKAKSPQRRKNVHEVRRSNADLERDLAERARMSLS